MFKGLLHCYQIFPENIGNHCSLSTKIIEFTVQIALVGRDDKTYFDFLTVLGTFDHADIEKLRFLIFGHILRS